MQDPLQRRAMQQPQPGLNIQTDLLLQPNRNIPGIGMPNPNANGRQSPQGFGGQNGFLSPNGMAAPGLSLEQTNSSSNYQFVSKKARKQAWLTQFKKNKTLKNEFQLKGYDRNKNSKAFLITIKGTFGIPLSSVLDEYKTSISGSKFSLEYYMTLFNKDIGTNGSFYGRTFSSSPILLKDASGSSLDTTQEQHVYFHTNYTEKTSFAVIECVVIREFNGLKNYSSAGYALCSIFDFGGLTTVDLMRGSPRTIGLIGLTAANNAMKSTGKLQFEIRDFEKINPIKKLIPQNCFFAPGDVIPGLVGDKMPPPRVGNNNLGQGLDIQQCKVDTIYIHNMQLITSIAFESRFETFLKKVKLERSRTAKMGQNQFTTDNVLIQERTIKVCANNSWQILGDEQTVSLLRPNEQGIIVSGGSISMKNFICHPLVALVFRIEYKVLLPDERDNKEMYFNIGWTYNVPTLNQMGGMTEEQLDTEIELGPGEVPTGDLLWDANADDMNHYEIRLRALISTNPQAPVDNYDRRNEIKTPFNQQISQFGQQNPINAFQNFSQPQQNVINPMGGFGAGQGAGQRGLVQPAMLGAGNMNNNFDNDVMRKKELQVQEMQERIRHQEMLFREQQQRFEALEMTKFQQQNQMQAGQPDYRAQEEKRLLEIQKSQIQNELNLMHSKMQEYQQSLKETAMNMNKPPYYQGTGGYQQQQQQMNQYNPYQQQQQQMGGSYADHFNQMSGIPFDQSSSKQIAMIGNVFYNMLNLIGENERDKRIIGLGENLKKMIQQQRFDDLLAPKSPYVNMNMVNLLKTTDLPISEQINIIKRGQGDLLQHPTAQITSNSIHHEGLSLQVEAADPLKASTIQFKFLCFKAPTMTQEYLPNKLCFQFKFFTFPSIQTDKVKIVSDQNSDGQYKLGQVFYLSREHPGVSRALQATTTTQMQATMKSQTQMMVDTRTDPNLLQITFEIDPSDSMIKDQNTRLASYLKERFLTVDVFDGETLFLYGVLKIPLFELMRQGKQTIVRAKECEMCDPQTGEFRGAIQLIMSNQGRYMKIQENESAPRQGMMKGMDSINQRVGDSPQRPRIQPSQHDGSGKKSKYKKVVKSKPMDLTKMQQTNNEMNNMVGNANTMTNFNQSILSQMNPNQISQVSLQNADLRKKLRVDRVRKMTIGHKEASATYTSVEDPSQPDWAKIKSLKEIEIIRQTKRDSVLNKVLDEYSSTSDQLSVIQGQLEFFNARVHNPFNMNEVYTVHINDPDEAFAQPEMTLVTDHAELRKWAALGKFSKDVDYEAIQKTGDIFLKPNDEVELLFKFLTHRDVITDKHAPATADTIKPRKIQIIILQTNRQPYNTIELNIVPSSAIIDHTFRFYEPENSHVTLTIPPFIQLNHPGLMGVISRPNVTVELDKSTNSFKVETRTLEAPDLKEMTLFVYGDQFKEQILASCTIEVYSMKTIYSQIKAGVQTIQNLSLPAENARQVMIHSENPRLVYLPKRALNQTFKIIPQTINNISICAKAFLATRQRVRVNCTDVNTGYLVYQWLMIIDADNPTVTQVHQVQVQLNYFSSQQLRFNNRLNQQAAYEFATSRPDLVRPNLDRITFREKEAKMIQLDFSPQAKFGSVDVHLFANDLDYNVVECHLLKITYLP